VNGAKIAGMVVSTLFRFYIGLLSRKSEVFHDMFGLAQLQPSDSEKTVDGLPVVRLHDSAEDFAHLLSALLDYECAARYL
jgi:hypothetical protein